MAALEALSSLKQFTWSFSVNYNPTSITCCAVSEDDARKEVLKYLTKIDVECKIYRDYRTYLPHELRDIVDKDAHLNIGCYTKKIEYFHLKMEIYTGNKYTTLGEYIQTEKPYISDFKKITVFSCLDG